MSVKDGVGGMGHAHLRLKPSYLVSIRDETFLLVKHEKKLLEQESTPSEGLQRKGLMELPR